MKNTGAIKRLLSWVLLSVMLLTALPFTAGSAEGQYAYVIIPNTTKNRVVNFRPSVGTSDYIDLLPEFWVVQIIGEKTSKGEKWYQVKTHTTGSAYDRTGYIMAKFVQPMNDEELARYLSDPGEKFFPEGSGDQPQTDEYSNYAVTIVDGVPAKASIGGESFVSLPKGIVFNVIQAPAGNAENDWYYGELDGLYGYVQAPYVRRLMVSELGSYVLPDPPSGSTATPEPHSGEPYGGAISGYVKLVKDLVNIRKTPGGTVLTSTNAKRLRIGLILPFTGIPASQGGYEWVYTTHNGYTGYVRSDCYVYCDENGNPISIKPTPVPEPTAAPGERFVTLTKGGVNVREKPAGKTTGVQLAKGTILKFDYIAENTGDRTLWYHAYVPTLGRYGFILSTMGYISDAKGNATGEQPSPAPAPVPTGAPVYTGYIATSIGSVWVRSAPDSKAGTLGQIAKKMTVLQLAGSPVYNNPYTWYPIRIDGSNSIGYVRGDCAFQLADWQYEYYIGHGVCPTNSPAPATPKPGNSSYVITTASDLWVRQNPSKKSSTLAQIKEIGTVLKFTASEKVSGVTWYKVNFNGETGWIHGSYARVMTNAEYEAYIGTLPTSTPKPTPTPMPDPSLYSDVALTTDERVKIRKAPSMSGKELTMVYNPGSELVYLGNYNTPAADNPYYWFNVRFGSVSGWMRGDFVRVLTQEEKAMYEMAGDPDAPREATYRTISRGDSGEDVLRLNQTLCEMGYLAETYVTDEYTSATESAVIAFQRAQKLTVDGIAGEKTQHALYGTVPTGTYSGGSVESIVYPVEKVDWFTGDIQQVWRVGVKAIVTDVYTGIAWRAQRIYGDKHADVEPATKEDTKAYCKIFKVQNPQEIVDREQELQSYRRRPLWVTIGSRTFAASLYAEPHNFDGDRIPDNDFNGQLCVHFVNSRTHESDVVDYPRKENGYFSHQQAIQYAYDKYWEAHKNEQ